MHSVLTVADQAHLQLGVSQVSFKEQDATCDGQREGQRNAQRHKFMTTMFSFYTLLLEDSLGLQTRLLSHMRQTYGCHSLQVQLDLSLDIHMTYAADRVVKLQCDASSGLLSSDIQRCLITTDVLDHLDIADLSVQVQVTDGQWRPSWWGSMSVIILSVITFDILDYLDATDLMHKNNLQ